MAETTADVRRDIEMTRERMSTTISQLEQKLNLTQIVRDHPWPALAVAVGAGVLLSGSKADVKAAAATLAATQGASSRVGNVLDDAVASLVAGVSTAFQDRLAQLVNELKDAIGAPSTPGAQGAGNTQNLYGDQSTARRDDVRLAGNTGTGDGALSSSGGFSGSQGGSQPFAGDTVRDSDRGFQNNLGAGPTATSSSPSSTGNWSPQASSLDAPPNPVQGVGSPVDGRASGERSQGY